MPTLELLTRRHCCLCQDAEAALRTLGLPEGYRLALVDVDSNDALARQFGARVPILRRDGRELAAGRLDEAVLAAALGSL